MHQGSVQSSFLFAVVVDFVVWILILMDFESVVTELAREGVLRDLLYDDDLFLMSETINRLWNMLVNRKKAFECRGLKFDPGKSKFWHHHKGSLP